jgi:hypothetical protein
MISGLEIQGLYALFCFRLYKTVDENVSPCIPSGSDSVTNLNWILRFLEYMHLGDSN